MNQIKMLHVVLLLLTHSYGYDLYLFQGKMIHNWSQLFLLFVSAHATEKACLFFNVMGAYDL